MYNNYYSYWLYTIRGVDWWTGVVDWTTGLTNFYLNDSEMLHNVIQLLPQWSVMYSNNHCLDVKSPGCSDAERVMTFTHMPNMQAEYNI